MQDDPSELAQTALPTNLREALTQAFNYNELRELCEDAGLSPETIAYSERGTEVWAYEIIRTFQHKNKLPMLVAQCQIKRPQVAWNWLSLPLPQSPPAGWDAPIAPRRAFSALFILMGLVGVVVIGLLIANSARLFSITPPTPTPGPQAMSGTFNVLVAQFATRNKDDNQVLSDDGMVVSQWVYENLATELQNVAGAQVWHDSMPNDKKGRVIGFVKGADPAERRTTALALAKAVGAHLVIYGDFAMHANTARFEPEFVVATSVISIARESEAEDLVGSYRLGAPVEVPFPVKFESGALAGAALKARALFVRGLLHDLLGQHDTALTAFRAAKPDWDKSAGQGKELLNYFMGREALFLQRNQSKAKAELIFGSVANARQAAVASFESVLSQNPDSALGHWGMGTAQLKLSEDVIADGVITSTEFPVAVATLQQAIEHYRRALQLIDAKTQPLLAARVRASLANGLRLDGLAKFHQTDDAAAQAAYAASVAEATTVLAVVQGQHARTTAATYSVRGITLINWGVLHLMLDQPEAGHAKLREAQADLEACLKVTDDPGGSKVLDETLTDFKDNNCKPALATVADLLPKP
jgi:tetratricopeptide (TPR) repeat protein